MPRALRTSGHPEHLRRACTGRCVGWRIGPAVRHTSLVDRRGFLKRLGAGVAFAAAGGLAWHTYETKVERHEVTLPSLDRPLTVVFATDVHYGHFVPAGLVGRWVDRIVESRADLVLLGGDLVDQWSGRDRTALVRHLQRLRAPLGTYAVWGNHDHVAIPDLRRFGAELDEAGVHVLDNEGVLVRPDLWLAGIDDLRAGRPDLVAALSGRPDTAATLLLSHSPDVLPHVPADVGLTLAGHTHGGQVCLPGGVPVVTSSRYGRRFARGWVSAPSRAYVSRGLGVTLLPIRTFCSSELTVLHFVPQA